MTLRPYQAELKAETYRQWALGRHNVCLQLATGGGKTELFCELIAEHNGASAVIVHRNELVSQISLTLARHGIRHNLIASAVTRRIIVALHMAELGRSYYDPGSLCGVASVDTLKSAKGIEQWAAMVTLAVTDEAHHVLADNKWGKALDKFTHPLCHGLLPTATPKRADGQGLGRESDGVADVMIEGPPVRWLIVQGYLCDYRIVCPTSDIEVLGEVGASGDWSTKQLKDAARRSHIVGDTVTQYGRWAAGRLGITFCTDVETAVDTAKAYNAAGVRAEVLTGETDPLIRRTILRKLAAREIDMLVAVDVVSEGFDLPALEVGMFARPTQSLIVWFQQLGRLLRPVYAPGFDLSTQAGRLAAIAASSKPYALIVDQVGNFVRHEGGPDRPRVWTLDRRERASRSSEPPLYRVCTGTPSAPGCTKPYERYLARCPYCGLAPPDPGGRSRPEQVAGDLAELDPATLAAIRGDVLAVQMTIEEKRADLIAKFAPPVAVMAQTARHGVRLDAHGGLRFAKEAWVRKQLARGLRDREIHRLFYKTFGVDVLSADALGTEDAMRLTARVAAQC